MVIISGAYGKLKRWVKARIATHKADSSAHHTKYLDSEAVTAVSNADNYIKNTGDEMTGTIVCTKRGAGGGFDVTDYFNIFRMRPGGEYCGWYGYDGSSNKLVWFGAEKKADVGGSYSGYFGYWVSWDGGPETLKLSIERLKVQIFVNLFLSSVKSGSTQALAGSAANEVWKTNGHASLPDNVLMIGV